MSETLDRQLPAYRKGGRVSHLTPEQWAEAEKLAVAGMLLADIGAKFGVDSNIIKQRAFQKNWATPARVAKMREEMLSREYGDHANITDANQGSKTAQTIAENIENYVSRTRNAVLKLVPGIEEAVESPRMRPSSTKELAAQVGLVWKVTGQDKPQVNIQANVWTGGSFMQTESFDGAVIETEGEIEANDEA